MWKWIDPMAWIVADLYAAQTVCVGYRWLRVMARHHDFLRPSENKRILW